MPKNRAIRLLCPEIVRLSLLSFAPGTISAITQLVEVFVSNTQTPGIVSPFQHFPPTITLDIFSSASGIELLELGNADGAAASAGNT